MKHRPFIITVIVTLFFSNSVYSQENLQISGVITGKSGIPIKGAQVFFQDTEIGAVSDITTVTDIRGEYQIIIPYQFVDGRKFSLRAAAEGFNAAEVEFYLDFAQKIERVDIVLYGSESKTQAVEPSNRQEKTDVSRLMDIGKQNYFSDLESILQKNTSAVRVAPLTGKPGDDLAIRLRGATSISGSNRPLIVVDGVITENNLRDLDLLDAADIRVLKGASSSAFYGARGAAGVIEFDTKSGLDLIREGTSITFKSQIGMNQIGVYRNPIHRNHNFLVGEVDGNLTWVDQNGDPVGAKIIQVDEDPLTRISFQDNEYFELLHDNLQEFFDTRITYQNQISFSKKSKNSNYRFSASNHENSGAVRDVRGNSRNAMRIKLDHQANEKLDIGISAYYSQSLKSDPQAEVNPFIGLLLRSPTKNINDIEFDLIQDPNSHIFLSEILESNPVYALQHLVSEIERTRTMGSIYGEYLLTDNLSLVSNLGFNRWTENNWFYAPIIEEFSSDVQKGGQLNTTNDEHETLNTSTELLYNISMKSLDLKLRGGYTYENAATTRLVVKGEDLSVSNVRDFSVVQGSKRLDSGIEEIIAHGFFVSAAWDYEDRFAGDLFIRRDGSSLFGQKERWHNYFRGIGRYNISKESWLDLPEIISDLKLSYAVGTAGTRPHFDAQYEVYPITQALASPILDNPFIKPEHTLEQEFGIDISISNRLNMQFVYAFAKTKDLLLSVPLPGIFRHSRQWRNAAVMNSKTFEAVFNYQVYQSKDLGWQTRFLIDKSRQRITEFKRQPYRTDSRTGSHVFYIQNNDDYGTLYGKYFMRGHSDLPKDLLPFADRFQVNDDGLLVWVGEGNNYTDGASKQLWNTSGQIEDCYFQFGMPIEMLNDEGEPFTRFGRATPDFSWTFMNDVRWKNLSLFMMLDAEIGGLIYNQTKQKMYRELAHRDIDQFGKLEAFKKPTSYYSTLYNGNGTSSWFVENGTFIKLRELSLQYQFTPAQVRSFFGDMFGASITNFTIGVKGRNLLKWTDYSGFDPEVGGGTVFRVDNFDYPRYRQLSAFVEIGF